MFDNIRYNGDMYQTKDTPTQLIDTYEIREDGTLWVECYTETWHEDEDSLFGIQVDRKDYYWKFCDDFDGVIKFYAPGDPGKWIEFKALFMDGKMIKIERIDSD